jgi:hypothetical protein
MAITGSLVQLYELVKEGGARICVQVSMAEHLRTSEVTGMIEPSCLILEPKLE